MERCIRLSIVRDNSVAGEEIQILIGTSLHRNPAHYRPTNLEFAPQT